MGTVQIILKIYTNTMTVKAVQMKNVFEYETLCTQFIDEDDVNYIFKVKI